jgi:hypothetical protein
MKIRNGRKSRERGSAWGQYRTSLSPRLRWHSTALRSLLMLVCCVAAAHMVSPIPGGGSTTTGTLLHARSLVTNAFAAENNAAERNAPAPDSSDMAGDERDAAVVDSSGVQSALEVLLKSPPPDLLTIEEAAGRLTFPLFSIAATTPWVKSSMAMLATDPIFNPQKYATIYLQAKDGRHVVLTEALWLNQIMAANAPAFERLYTSSSGLILRRLPEDLTPAATGPLAGAAMVFPTVLAKDPTGYLIQVPDSLFVITGINGTLSDPDLHALVDRMVRVKKGGN